MDKKEELPDVGDEVIDEQDRESWVAMAIALGYDVEE